VQEFIRHEGWDVEQSTIEGPILEGDHPPRRTPYRTLVLSPFLLLLLGAPGGAPGQGNFVYTNTKGLPYSVSGFAISANGTLTEVSSSPSRPVAQDRFVGTLPRRASLCRE
jgi:hypothetical protein